MCGKTDFHQKNPFLCNFISQGCRNGQSGKSPMFRSSASQTEPFFSSLASSLILDLETNLDSNSVSFDVPAGRVVSGGRGKHPVYKTVRKKILKISLAPTDFKREELIRMWSPSASFIFYFSFFFSPRKRAQCVMFHVTLVIFIIGDLDHLYLWFIVSQHALFSLA